MKEYIVNFWNGLKPLYKIIIVVVLALLIISIIKKYGDQLSSFFQSRKINYGPGENAGNQGYQAGGGDPTKGKSFIENLADNIYRDIYETPWSGHNSTYYEEANTLSDSDLLYMADYYKEFLTKGVGLFEDMDNESYTVFTDNFFSNAADVMKTRLIQIGVK